MVFTPPWCKLYTELCLISSQVSGGLLSFNGLNRGLDDGPILWITTKYYSIVEKLRMETARVGVSQVF